MTGMFLWMINKAKFASTRRMSLLPLCCAGMELLATGILTPELFPLLTFLLISMRIAILACCVGAMRRDAAMAARRTRRKAMSLAVTKTVRYSESGMASERCA